MALFTKRPFSDVFLELDGDREANHIFEPEFHQDLYVDACVKARQLPGSFQLGDLTEVVRYPNRGSQPNYCDDESVPESLTYIGKINTDGTVITSDETSNICALKSVSIRWGFVDFGVARAVDHEFYQKKKKRNEAIWGDVLINSTGDGTIGRVAVYNRKHPALVDGHITIVRFKNTNLAWYTAAYLLSDQGQKQVYRYINGSSGQVEIYPQDIARIWIPKINGDKINAIAEQFQTASKKYEEFQSELSSVLAKV